MSKADGKDSVEEKNELLRQSVEKEDFEEFKRLLKDGAQLWPRYRSRESCLHIAVSKENMEFVRFILQHYVQDVRQNNATFQRIDEGKNYSREYIEECELTVEDYMRDCGPSAIQLAAEINNTEIVREILNAGGMADAGDDEYPPLFWAVFHKNVEMVNILLDHGACQDREFTPQTTWKDEMEARATRPDKKKGNRKKGEYVFAPKESPFLFSLRRGWGEVLKIMLQKRNPRACNIGNSDGSALFYAVLLRNRDAVKGLLEMGASPAERAIGFSAYGDDEKVKGQWSILQLAIIKGDRKIFDDLLARILNPAEDTYNYEKLGEDYNTPIRRKRRKQMLEKLNDYAATHGGVIFPPSGNNEVVESRSERIARYRREYIYDTLNFREPGHGYTALHLAVYLGNATFVKELLKANANVHVQTFEEEKAPKEARYPCYADTPLTLAIRMLTGQLKYPMDEHKYQRAYQTLQEGASKNDGAALPPYDEWYAAMPKDNKEYNTEREKKGQNDFVKNLLEVIRELVKAEKDCEPMDLVLQSVRSLESVKGEKKEYRDAWICCRCLLRSKG